MAPPQVKEAAAEGSSFAADAPSLALGQDWGAAVLCQVRHSAMKEWKNGPLPLNK